MTLRILDLFSGIGGFSLAARWLGGFETVQFVERDPFCQRILHKHWPTVPIHDDICTFQPEPGSADVVVGGFPCQDISIAGNRAGIGLGTVPGCFTNSCESFAWWDRATSSWRTSQASVLTGWELYCQNWPAMGVLASGHAYQLPILELGTFAIVGGLFPTPTATEWKGAPKNRFIGSPHWRGARTSESLRRCETDPPLVHPSYAEALMGFPMEWTACEP